MTKESTAEHGGATAQGEQPFIEMHNATVRRAGKDILSVDSFLLPCGQHVALLGPNGSGKSTFVRLMTREILPLHRQQPPIRFMGNERPTLDQVKQAMGVVSSTMQNQIAMHTPAVEVVAGGLFGTLGLSARLPQAQYDQACHQAVRALERLGVGELAGQDILTLSTGEARRVLIARALIHNPQVLVFDEPCTGLDPQGMFYVRANMRTLAAQGVSLVLVTHYPEDIIPEVERLVLLKEGRVFADGAKSQLLTDETMSALYGVPLRVAKTAAPSSAERPFGKGDDAHGEAEYFSLVSAY